MPKGSKKGGGLEVKKEYKSKGMPYAPFKMSGHTLPGPNQSSALKERQDEVMRASAGSSGLGGGMSNVASQLAALTGGGAFGQWSGKRREASSDLVTGESNKSAVEAGISGLSDSTAFVGADRSIGATDDVTKKKVDVEVTVNDKKI